MCYGHTETEKHTNEEERTGDEASVGSLPASGSEAACSLFEGLEGTPTWLELHSVLRGKEPAREQEKQIQKVSGSNDSSQKNRNRTCYQLE